MYMDNKLIPLNKEGKDKKNFIIYKELEESMKDLKCDNPDEIKHINEYLSNLDKEHWKLLENVQDKTGKEKPHICSKIKLNCKSINKTVQSTKKQLGWKAIILKQFVTKELICSNLIPRHFKLLLTLKKNKDTLSKDNFKLYQHILTNFVDLLKKLGLIQYLNHPRVQKIGPSEIFYGGKKTKKQTPLQILKLKHRNQLNNLKNKQKNDVLKLKSKHQKDLKKLCT